MEIGESQYFDIDPPRFFTLSFRYSQGSESLQNVIFNYFASLGIKTNIPDLSKEVFKNLKVPKKHKTIFNPHTVPSSFNKQWLSMKNRLGNKDNKYSAANAETLLNEITDWSIKKDIEFLNKGRQGRDYKKSQEPDDENDPWMSIVRKYALEGNSTGHFLFDYLFKQIGIKVQHHFEQERPDVERLKELWEYKHEGKNFS